MREEARLPVVVCVALGVLLMSSRLANGLTTFGKPTNTQNQNQNPAPVPTPIGKGKECRLDSDCAGIQNTTCMADPRDGKTKCLCGDYSAPLNGVCNIKFRAIRAPCNEDAECVPGGECVKRNTTIPGKRCYCKEGFYEDNLECNGSSALTFSFYTTALLALSMFSVKIISL